VQLKIARQLKEIIEQLAKAKKARELGRSDRDLKALELKLAECQSVVDEVGDPPLKFLKAVERVKLVPPTTHKLGQGGILGLKAAFVSTLPLLHFFLAKIRIKLSFC
jgi:predicted RNA-binding Zn ribbon-like protein